MSMESPYVKDGWYVERSFHGHHSTGIKINAVLHHERSQYQDLTILQTESIGRLLLLDGKTMVCDIDEFVYHECMAHIPYMTHPNAKKVLIIGGGDGGIVREFVRHPDLEQIDLVEIDERVVEVSKKYLPHIASGLSDKRVNLHATDGLAFIRQRKNYYDIVLVDSTDPENFAAGLFKEDFYRDVFNALKEDGIMAAQTENPFLDQYDIRSIYDNLRKVFPNVQSFAAPMIIYPGVFWTWAFASKKYKGQELIEAKVSAMKEMEKSLKWYNHQWHKGAFCLSNLHKKVAGID